MSGDDKDIRSVIIPEVAVSEDEVSSDLISSLDMDSDASIEIEDPIEMLKDQYKVDPQSVYNVLPAREYGELELRLLAERFYHDWFLASKKYIRFYCTLNNYTQKWIRKITTPPKEYTYGVGFRPFMYSFSLRKFDSTEIPIVSNILYSEECTILAGEGLGFSNSDAYKALLAAYDINALETVLKNASYFARVRNKKTLLEHKNQIEKSLTNKEIPLTQKMSWISDITQRLMAGDL